MISKLVLETWEVSISVKNDKDGSNYHIGSNTVSFVKYTENSDKEMISALNYSLLNSLAACIDRIMTPSDIWLTDRRNYLPATVAFLFDAIIDTMKEHKEKSGFSLSARFISDYMKGYNDRHGEFKFTVSYIGESDPFPNNVERI